MFCVTAIIAFLETLVWHLLLSNATNIHKTAVSFVCLWKFCIQMLCSKQDINEIANEQNSNDEGAYPGLNVVIDCNEMLINSPCALQLNIGQSEYQNSIVCWPFSEVLKMYCRECNNIPHQRSLLESLSVFSNLLTSTWFGLNIFFSWRKGLGTA